MSEWDHKPITKLALATSFFSVEKKKELMDTSIATTLVVLLHVSDFWKAFAWVEQDLFTRNNSIRIEENDVTLPLFLVFLHSVKLAVNLRGALSLPTECDPHESPKILWRKSATHTRRKVEHDIAIAFFVIHPRVDKCSRVGSRNKLSYGYTQAARGISLSIPREITVWPVESVSGHPVDVHNRVARF